MCDINVCHDLSERLYAPSMVKNQNAIFALCNIIQNNIDSYRHASDHKFLNDKPKLVSNHLVLKTTANFRAKIFKYLTKFPERNGVYFKLSVFRVLHKILRRNVHFTSI